VHGADAAEELPQRLAQEWAVDRVASLVPDLEAGVDELDEMIGSDSAFGIGRGGIADRDAVEIDRRAAGGEKGFGALRPADLCTATSVGVDGKEKRIPSSRFGTR
jgi:hypothetical protein